VPLAPPTAPPGTSEVPGLGAHVEPSCSGTGTDGKRVQVLYVVEADHEDRFAQVSATIAEAVANTDDIFAASARKTGGGRRVRWVHDPHTCQPVIRRTVVPAGALGVAADPVGAYYSSVEALEAAGYTSANRKYLFFADASAVCGIATSQADDNPVHNRSDERYPGYARVDTACWLGSLAAHELMHTLGAVQASAPHASSVSHCSDDSDVMCYDDGTVTVSHVCNGDPEEYLFDCHNDDYFNLNPPAGSYLATHWNTARSSFLDNAPILTTAAPPGSRRRS
jgi:hypothetical protein